MLNVSKERYIAGYDIALIYAALADTENTFAWLERAMEDRSTMISFLAQDPMFDSFHSDPRWAALIRRIGIYRPGHCRMARLHPLQRHGHHRRQSLDDEHIVSTEAGLGLMVNDPNSAQRCAVIVVQRNDQRFANRRLNSHQIGKCPLRARQDNCCAAVQTQSAGAR